MPQTKFLDASGVRKIVTELRKEVTRRYIDKGSVASLAALPNAVQTGWVFNITNGFTTTADFVEGAGKEYPANTNIVCVDVSVDPSVVTLKWDVLSGDFTDYQKKELTSALALFTPTTVADSSALPATAVSGINLYDVYKTLDDGKLHRVEAIAATTNAITWLDIGDQTSVEGAIKLLAAVCPIEPITDAEIETIFNNA